MGSFDKLFGLVLVLAGISIAAYYSVWVFLSTNYTKHLLPAHLSGLFPPAEYLFKLPAMALVIGVILIWTFISRTIASIEAKKVADAAKKVK